MTAHVPHKVPPAVGDQRVLFFARGAHVVPWGRRWAPPRPLRLAVGLSGHEPSDRSGWAGLRRPPGTAAGLRR